MIILLLVWQILFRDISIGAPVSDVVTHSKVKSQNGFTNKKRLWQLRSIFMYVCIYVYASARYNNPTVVPLTLSHHIRTVGYVSRMMTSYQTWYYDLLLLLVLSVLMMVVQLSTVPNTPSMTAISSLLQYILCKDCPVSMIYSMWRIWCWMQRANNSYLWG